MSNSNLLQLVLSNSYRRVKSYLDSKTRAELIVILNEAYEVNGETCTLFIFSARLGYSALVKLFITSYLVDLEQEGVVKFDRFVIKKASALWCSVAAGHLDVVKILVEHGAQINHSTATNSTPLRAACFNGRLDLVIYLVEHGADITLPNTYGNTCLIMASYKGHYEVVKYLLARCSATEIDSRAHCGASAINFAADCGHLRVVKLLIERGAQLFPNKHGLTPLLLACEKTKENVANYLMGLDSCTRLQRIQGLELLGASFANDKDSYDLAKAYHYLWLGLEKRGRPAEIPKPRAEPILAYGYRRECQSLEQLDSIQFDAAALHMEGLVVRERILGSGSPELPQQIIYRGAVYADNMEFVSCLNLWLHALQLRLANRQSICKDLLRFAQVFSQMLRLQEGIPFAMMASVLAALVRVVEQFEDCVHEMESYMLTTLYLLNIVTICKNFSRAQEVTIKRDVYRLVQLDPRTEKRESLLHLAVDYRTLVDDFHVSDVCKFPDLCTVTLLLDCGADPLAGDLAGNTPLHLISQYIKPVSNFSTLHGIMVSLLRAGAHWDMVNRQGRTALQTATTGVSEIILKTEMKLSLKCMAARTIRKYYLSYQGLIPKSLEEFVLWH